MIVAIQTLVLIRQSLLTVFQRFFCPYYRQLSLVFIGRKDEDEADDEDQVFADYDDERGVVFYPPMYAQRYAAVTDCLMDEQWAGKLEKVVDLGYHDLSFVKYLKDLPGVIHIMGVDIESMSLRCSSELLASEGHTYKRDTPLEVTLFEGNAADPDYRLIGCDAVIAIEMIEHMLPHDLERLVHNVFGFIKPWIAIFTTPNADFNVLFKNLEQNGLRRMDHLFEWTREQFYDWCSNIVTRYPQFTVQCKGIGPGPPGTQHLGCCSQMALFVNTDYQKQNDLEPNSLALVEKIPSPYDVRDKIGWDSSDPDTSEKEFKLTDKVESQKNLFSEQSCITIFLSQSSYSMEDFTYRDSTSQCNLDSERGRNYLMFDQDDTLQVLVPTKLLDQKCYVMEDVFNRLNCSTLQVKKFSKTTQNLMAKNDVDSLVHTRDVVKLVRHLTDKLNFNKTGLENQKDNSHIWSNINWGENAPFWNHYYKVVKEYHYPFETESDEGRILDLISEEINRLIDSQYDEEFSLDVYKLEIPISHLMNVVRHITMDFEHVKDLLDWNGYEVVNDTVVHSRKIMETPSTGSQDEWNEKDLHSEWDYTDTRSTISGAASNFSNGRCLRRALDKKVRQLYTMTSGDVDIAAELDAVISRLIRLTLWACKRKQQPPASRWMQRKLFDLLVLKEKAIGRRQKYYTTHGTPMKTLTYVPGSDDIYKYKDDSSAQLIESRYMSLCFNSELTKPSTDLYQENVHGDLHQSSRCDILSDFNGLKRTHEWLEDDNTFEEIAYTNASDSHASSPDRAKKSKRDSNSDYSFPDTSPRDTAQIDIKLQKDNITKYESHKTNNVRKFNFRRFSMSLGKENDEGINDIFNSKRTLKGRNKLQSTPSKPIPCSIIELCHPDLSTQMNKGLNCFGNHIQPDLPISNVSATEESVLIDIIMDEMEETIALRRTVGTDMDDDHTVQAQESVLASIVNTHESEIPLISNHSQTVFLYDLNEPSTSKGVRHTNMDVQCGPDAGTPAYVMLSPASSVTEMPTTHKHATGINIEECPELTAGRNTFDTCTNVDNFGPVCQRTVSPNVFQKGIKIGDSETDVTTNPEDNDFNLGTLTAIEEYEHGTVFVMPIFRKTENLDASSNKGPVHQSLVVEKIMNSKYTYNQECTEFNNHHSNEKENCKKNGFGVFANDEKNGNPKSDAYEHSTTHFSGNNESANGSSFISRKQDKPPGAWLNETLFQVILQDERCTSSTEKPYRPLSPLLSKTLEPTIDTNLLNLISSSIEIPDSSSDFREIVTSPKSSLDLFYTSNIADKFLLDASNQVSNKCQRTKLICGGLHTHSYKDKQEFEDVMYQGLWQKYLTHANKTPDDMVFRSRPASANKLKYTGNINMKKMSRIPKLSNNVESKEPKDLRRKSVSPVKSNIYESGIPSNMSFRSRSASPNIRYFSESKKAKANDIAVSKKSVTPAPSTVKKSFKPKNMTFKKIPVIATTENDRGKGKMTFGTLRGRSVSPTFKNKTDTLSPILTLKSNSTILSPTTENSNSKIRRSLSRIVTKKSTVKNTVNPATIKNDSDSKDLSSDMSLGSSVSPTRMKLNSTKLTEMTFRKISTRPNNTQDKTTDKQITNIKKKIKIESERNPVAIKSSSPKRPKEEPTEAERTKQSKMMSSKIRLTSCTYSIPADMTPDKVCIVARKSADKIINNKAKKNYIPSYLKRLKAMKYKNVSSNFDLTTTNKNLEDKSKSSEDTVETSGQKNLNDGFPESGYVVDMLKSELMKEIFAIPDEVVYTKKGITKFSTPSAPRKNNCKDSENDLLRYNIEINDISYLVFRNELDNNVKSSTNCNTTNSPRENTKKITNIKLTSSVVSNESSCSSPDSVATVKMVQPKSAKRYSTSSNKSSMANSESEHTTSARNRKYTKKIKVKKPDKILTDKENTPESSNTSDQKKSKSDKKTLAGRKKNVYLAVAPEKPLVDILSVHHSQTASNSNFKILKTNSDEKKRLKTVSSSMKSNDSSISGKIENQESTSSGISNRFFLVDSHIQEQNYDITMNRSLEYAKPNSSFDTGKPSTVAEIFPGCKESNIDNIYETISSTMRGLIFDSLELINTSSREIKPHSEVHDEISHTDILIPFESVCNDESQWSNISDSWDRVQGSTLKNNSKTPDMISFKSLTSDYYLAESELGNTSLSEPPAVDITSAEPDTPRADSVQDIFERKEPLMSPPKDVHCWTKASPKDLHNDRSCASRIQAPPATLTRSSVHLVGGLPTLSSAWSPLENFTTPTAICSTSYVPRPLPLKFSDSKGYIPVSGLAVQAFSGFSMNAEPTSGDKPDFVNLIDSETGSVAADFFPRQIASEELFVSGRSSESFISCVVDDDTVIPNWLFEIIQQQQQQAAAPIDQPPEFGPLPIEEVDSDLNNNTMDPVVGVTAGAGDGRGIHSDPSQDSSGHGTSLSSSDSSSGQTSVVLPMMDPSAFGQYELVREGNGSSAAVTGEIPTISIRNVDSPGNDSEILSTSRNEARRTRNHLLLSDADADVSSLDTDVPDSS